MKYIVLPVFGFITLLFVMFANPEQVLADAKILPPPTRVQDTPAARETVTAPKSETNLQQEFGSPDEESVDVRSYQRKDGTTVTEHSVHGRVYMIKVQPQGALPAYYLYDSDGDGTFERRLPGNYKPISPPVWVIQRF
ncbi:MAG: DUF2782 domain-containing protein [Mariprofundaceae bacterium]